MAKDSDMVCGHAPTNIGKKKMYTIGIIDLLGDSRDIQVSILEVLAEASPDAKVEFKEYDIEKSRDELLAALEDDIKAGRISSLIMEHRVVLPEAPVTGETIIDHVRSTAYEFPVVVITHDADAARVSLYIDADKVYEKKTFLNPETPDTKRMVLNIIHNMRRYTETRTELENGLADLLAEFEQAPDNSSLTHRILDMENRLSRYRPVSPAPVIQKLEFEKLKDACSLLESIC